MIQYANQHTAPQVRQMWKTVFGDSDAYMDIYFREKYRDETLHFLQKWSWQLNIQHIFRTFVP